MANLVENDRSLPDNEWLTELRIFGAKRYSHSSGTGYVSTLADRIIPLTALRADVIPIRC